MDGVPNPFSPLPAAGREDDGTLLSVLGDVAMKREALKACQVIGKGQFGSVSAPPRKRKGGAATAQGTRPRGLHPPTPDLPYSTPHPQPGAVCE